jgi:starch-binding outer membrane protein, SusD/RagB family
MKTIWTTMNGGLSLVLAVVLMTGLVSCDKMLEFAPGDVILAEDAINTPDDLQRLLTSTYDVLANLYGGRVQIVSELRGENFAQPDNSLDFTAIRNRETTFFTTTSGGVYTDFYYAIYRANVVMENFELVEGLEATDRLRLEAEARFVRAVCHWGAVKLYAQPYGYTAGNTHLGVPLRLESSQEPLPRTSVGDVYAAIVEDFEFAAANLPAVNGSYATSYAARGYLAEVNFLMMNWGATVAHATAVIDGGGFSLDEDLDRFETDIVSTESVFGIVSHPNDMRSSWFRDNLRSDNNPTPQLGLSADFKFFMDLSGGDGRNAWVTSSGVRYLCARFDGKEYFNVPLVHLSGLRLIRAEAQAEMGGDLNQAIADINAIRDRAFGAGFNDLAPDSDAETVRDAARDEYRKETICEGNWIEQLRRRGVMGEDISIQGAPWDCPGMALQFPNSETTAAGFILNEEGGCL